jgi:ATP-binding cassette subfamily C protein
MVPTIAQSNETVGAESLGLGVLGGLPMWIWANRTRRPGKQQMVKTTRTAQFRDFTGDLLDGFGSRVRRVALLSSLAVVAEGIGLLLIIPILSHVELREGAGHQAGLGLAEALLLYVVLVGAGITLVVTRSNVIASLRLAYIDDLRKRIHSALMAMNWAAYGQMRSNDGQHVLAVELPRAANGVDFLLRLGGWGLELAVLLILALSLSMSMTCAALLVAVAIMVFGRSMNRHAHEYGTRIGQASRAIGSDIADDIGGMRLIRSLGLEAARKRHLEERLYQMRELQTGFIASQGRQRVLSHTAIAAATAMGVWIGHGIGGLQLPETIALAVGIIRLAMAVHRIQDAWRIVVAALPAHAAAMDFLRHCSERAVPALKGGISPAQTQSPIEMVLRDVWFKYPDREDFTLSGICMTLPKGGLTAIIGPSGAGKSTLADLLAGLLSPGRGEVLVDGAPMNDDRRQGLRHRIGYVPHNSTLFHDTVRANLLMARPDADEASLWSCLEQVGANSFVAALPSGLDSSVGERGCLISEGQRQRLALARALLRNPGMLILDEALGGLDDQLQAGILEMLSSLRGTVTTVIIAHDRRILRHVDHIVVMDSGCVTVQDTWVKLETACDGPFSS